jgi:thioredoxin 1
MTSNELTDIRNRQDIDNIINDGQYIITVIDFYANWCEVCITIKNAYDNLYKKYTNVKFTKANIDDCPNLTTVFDIERVPTFKIFKRGSLVDSQMGADLQQLEQRIQRIPT